LQEDVYERETKRLSYEEKAVGEAFTKIMKVYIEEDKYQQYLVDGAVLRCNQATTEDFDYNGGTVVLENKADEVCNIVLDVHENPISGGTASESSMPINGHNYATVKDTLQEFNINPPKCNCRLAADRISEHDLENIPIIWNRELCGEEQMSWILFFMEHMIGRMMKKGMVIFGEKRHIQM